MSLNQLTHYVISGSPDKNEVQGKTGITGSTLMDQNTSAELADNSPNLAWSVVDGITGSSVITTLQSPTAVVHTSPLLSIAVKTPSYDPCEDALHLSLQLPAPYLDVAARSSHTNSSPAQNDSVASLPSVSAFHNSAPSENSLITYEELGMRTTRRRKRVILRWSRL
jgi:hypothetical protein